MNNKLPRPHHNQEVNPLMEVYWPDPESSDFVRFGCSSDGSGEHCYAELDGDEVEDDSDGGAGIRSYRHLVQDYHPKTNNSNKCRDDIEGRY